MKTMARFLVAGAILSGAGAATAQQPVTLTSTVDFQRGNNEGLISTAQNRVTRDRITAGTVGSWSSSTALPSGRCAFSSVAYNGFVYAIGGIGDAGFLSDVLVAPLNADGSVGAWSSTTALPSGRFVLSTVAYSGFVYAMGGYDPSGLLSDVLVAPLNTDGSVGAWSSTTALPSARDSFSTVVYNGFVYAMGGYDPSGLLSDVLVAPLNADGSVGAWSSTTALPSARDSFSSIAYNGFVYTFGGGDSSSYLSEVLVTPLNADGSVGAWSSTTALPSARYLLSSAVYNGFVYAIGGFDDSGTLSAVLIASIDADSGNANQTADHLRGAYSHLVDLLSDTSTLSILLNGQTGLGGSVRLQVRLAPDGTKVFGAETVIDPAPVGSVIQVSGTGRYVWIRLTLDDTGTTDVDQATYVSDITISPFPPPSAGVVFDGLGADIDTQTSTTTIEANWSGFTAGAGDSIASYEWAIGTVAGLANVQAWTNVGLATSASNSSLSLSPGLKYVSVRAISVSGLPSDIASSDGVQVIAPTVAPSGGGHSRKHCGHGASAAPGSATAILGGLALLASAVRRRRARA